jgi:hypothetical protein
VAFFGGHLVEVLTPDGSKYNEQSFLTDTVAERATSQWHDGVFEADLGSEPDLFYRMYPNCCPAWLAPSEVHIWSAPVITVWTCWNSRRLPTRTIS